MKPNDYEPEVRRATYAESWLRQLCGAAAIAKRIAANGPIAVRVTRQIVRECINRPEPEALAIEDRLGMAVYKTQDVQEGPRAFIEKRPPRFEGR